MKIGERLRQARQGRELTQEELAERIGVSRQTISSWENDRSYPDIGSVIALSELYGISLDELLKEDQKMIEHLKESTDQVRSRQHFSRVVVTAAYLVIWAALLGFFWMGGRVDAMGYSIVSFYLILPVVTAVLSFFIGRDEAWAGARWVMLLFFGVMYMLAPYATFAFANTGATGRVHLPELGAMLPGMLCSAAGMAVGAAARRLKERRHH